MIGMLWFEQDSKKPWSTRVAEAAKFYQEKYGPVPDTVLLPVGVELPDVAGMRILNSKSIIKNHLLIGVEGGEVSFAEYATAGAEK